MAVIISETINQRPSMYYIQIQFTADVTMMLIIKTIFKYEITDRMKSQRRDFLSFSKHTYEHFIKLQYQYVFLKSFSHFFQYLTNP